MNVMKIYHYYENQSLWWKYDIVIYIMNGMKTLLLWWKWFTVNENYYFNVNLSLVTGMKSLFLWWKLIFMMIGEILFTCNWWLMIYENISVTIWIINMMKIYHCDDIYHFDNRNLLINPIHFALLYISLFGHSSSFF